MAWPARPGSSFQCPHELNDLASRFSASSSPKAGVKLTTYWKRCARDQPRDRTGNAAPDRTATDLSHTDDELATNRSQRTLSTSELGLANPMSEAEVRSTP